jgi:hypothetical protein
MNLQSLQSLRISLQNLPGKRHGFSWKDRAPAIASVLQRRYVMQDKGSPSANEPRKTASFREANLSQQGDLKDGLPIVVVAGAAGKLGRKIFTQLLKSHAASYVDMPLSARPVDAVVDAGGAAPTKFKVVLLDSKPCPKDLDLNDTDGHEVEWHVCDLTKYDLSWVDKLSKAYVAFLLATKAHFHDANSENAYWSMVMNANLLEACAHGKVERVVIGSTTEVVKGRSDRDNEKVDPGAEPDLGDDHFTAEDSKVDSRLYAATKVANEAQARAMVSSGQLNRVVVLRIGANQPLQELQSDMQKNPSELNKPKSDAAIPKPPQSNDHHSLMQWFEDVSLQDEDLDAIVDACISPGLDSNKSKLIYVNAVSENPNSNLKVQNNELGYVPPSASARKQKPRGSEEKRKPLSDIAHAA